MKKIKYFDTHFEAEVVRGLLESAGLRAVVLNENAPYNMPGMQSSDWLKPCVAVHDDDAALAMEIIDANADNQPAAVCPQCGSTELKPSLAPHSPWLVVLYLIGTPFYIIYLGIKGLPPKYYKCRQCKNITKTRR